MVEGNTIVNPPRWEENRGTPMKSSGKIGDV